MSIDIILSLKRSLMSIGIIVGTVINRAIKKMNEKRITNIVNYIIKNIVQCIGVQQK